MIEFYGLVFVVGVSGVLVGYKLGRSAALDELKALYLSLSAKTQDQFIIELGEERGQRLMDLFDAPKDGDT